MGKILHDHWALANVFRDETGQSSLLRCTGSSCLDRDCLARADGKRYIVC
jgi:hypothetical protein